VEVLGALSHRKPLDAVLPSSCCEALHTVTDIVLLGDVVCFIPREKAVTDFKSGVGEFLGEFPYLALR